MRFPAKYVPRSLSRKDAKAQRRMLALSRRLYNDNNKKTKRKYYTRRAVPSFKPKKSDHVSRAKRMYGVATVAPNAALARKTGCSVKALRQIVRKGEGAYYSSGSRPNQTPQSWGLARLASALTAGKASTVDYAILEEGCDHKGEAYKLARTGSPNTSPNFRTRITAF